MSKEYRLPVDLRPKLARPLGQFFSAEAVNSPAFSRLIKSSAIVIAVGDRVTDTLGNLGRVPDVQVVDGRENRRKRRLPDVPFAREVRVRNPAGTITREAIAGMREALDGEKPVRVLVKGEEDLLAIPAIALAPSGAKVVYGQPREGIVVISADAEAKRRNRRILARIGITEIR